MQTDGSSIETGFGERFCKFRQQKAVSRNRQSEMLVSTQVIYLIDKINDRTLVVTIEQRLAPCEFYLPDSCTHGRTNNQPYIADTECRSGLLLDDPLPLIVTKEAVKIT
jgi:hypothetical protein